MVKRIVAIFVIPLLLFGLIELILRWSGFGVSPKLYLVGEWNGTTLATENPSYTRKYFGAHLERIPQPVAIPVPKPSGEFRIFLLGESAAMGYPIPRFGMANMIEVLLQDVMTNKRVRVVNSAITAINSHVIRDIAREVASLEPDAVVLYMGNNEIVGPFGPGTIFPAVAGNQHLTRFITFARGLRISQALEGLIWPFRQPAAQKWRGMEMFVDRPVAPGDPLLVRAYRSFEQNLNEICEYFTRRKIPLVISTVAVNLRDCSPLASPGPDQVANRHFLKARAFDEVGQFEEAARFYRAALEADVLRFRADTAINNAIRLIEKTYTNTTLALIDSERSVEEASPGKIPGESFFYDHVHLNFSGQYLVASNAASAIAKQFEVTKPLFSEQETANQLGWNRWVEKETFAEMNARRLRPPFLDQIDRSEVERRWIARLIDLETSCSYQCLMESRDILFQSLEKNPQLDSNRWRSLAAIEVLLDRPDLAAESFGRAARLLPHHATGLLLAQGAAMAALEAESGFAVVRGDKRFDHLPDDVIWSDFGSVVAGWGWTDRAETFFHRAWLINPDNTDALINLGVGRAVSGNLAEAVAMLRKAVKLRPQNDMALANLGRTLFESGDRANGIDYMERALKINPMNGQTHSSLAVMYFREENYPKAKEHFDAALMESPVDPILLADAARLAVEQKDYERAGELQRRAARLLPTDSLAQYMTGQLLLRAGQAPEAIEYLRAAVQLQPDQIAWVANLIWILAVHPDDQIRNPDEALTMANMLPENGVSAWVVSDLRAAALASLGKVDEAAELLGRIELQEIPDAWRDVVHARSQLYLSGLPYIGQPDEFTGR